VAGIRKATVRDLSEIVRLHRQASALQARMDRRLEPSNGDARRISRVLRSMIAMPDFSVLVGQEEGVSGLAGFTLGSIVDNKPFAVSRFGYIGCLCVDGSHRKQGLGDELWLAVRGWLTGKGLATAQTDVSLRNRVAQTFWKDRGFESYLDHFRRNIEPELRETGAVGCEIRGATSVDIDSILVLWKEMMDIHAAIDERLIVGPTWSEQVVDFVEEWLRNPEDRLIVADAHPGVIGFAVGSVVDTALGLKPPRYGHVAHLCVRADVRRRGVGRRLFGELRNWFRERELASIHLYASHFNLTSQSFWRSVGFENYAERRWCNLV
jgi:ribosomal protein S18 acetylase RimI-like enzyme